MNFIISLEVYPFDIMFSVGETNKQFKKLIKKHVKEQSFKDLQEDIICNFSETQRGRTYHHLQDGFTIIRFPKDVSHGTIAHEIFHAVHFITAKIGLTLSMDSDEAFAYLIGYVTDKYYLHF